MVGKSWAEMQKNMNLLDNITLLQVLGECGMPGSEEERTALLVRLRVQRMGDYPVTYEGLCHYSESFLREYPKERVVGLIKRVITGANPYQMEINHASISDEDKALLLLVLPMSRTLAADAENDKTEP